MALIVNDLHFFTFDERIATMKKLVFLIVLLIFGHTVQAALRVENLRVEGLANPAGVDVPSPRFSWLLMADHETGVLQQSYQILVASSPELLNKDQGDIWNSGRVKSSVSVMIPFTGSLLRSNAEYFWKVKVWTNRGATAWSDAAKWSMGLLAENDWKSRWIGLDKASPWDSETQWSRLSARYLRKEFSTAKTVKRATVHIAGLGLYELFINGQRVGNQVLAPAPTDYRKSILYNTYEVTELLSSGNNAIGVTLGNGRYYTMRQDYKPYKINTFGYPKLRMNLIIEYADGSTESIGSNESWKLTADGPIRSNNEYDGEEYDARKELGNWAMPGYDDSNWQQAQRVTIPIAELRSQMMPGMKVLQTIQPISMKSRDDALILDFGQNLTGWMRIRVKGNAGDSIVMRFAETLQEDGSLFMANLRDARVTDVYVLKGDPNGEEWAPRFVYHGFRFAEVRGLKHQPLKENFIAEMVADEMELTGHFNSSNDVLNQVLQNAWWGILGNYKGMPVDCPQRNERQPWLGDRTMGSWGESFLFNVQGMYAKWARDIREAQRSDGAIPDVAPAYWNYYSDNVTWPAALPMACDMLYTQYGDLQSIRDNYSAIQKWLNYMRTHYMNKEYIVDADKYGDWCVPPESPEMIHSRDPNRQTNGALMATAYYYKILRLMEKFAGLQGLNNDQREFSALADNMKKAFHQTFFRSDSLFYGNNSATSNLLPLAFDIVPQQFRDTVAKQVIRKLVPNNMPAISTGVIGTQWIMRQLSRMGRADVAFALAANDRYPSWGYMAAQGATTIWELWNGNTANPAMNSGNHVMLLGDLIPWVYENLAGIRSSSEHVAFKHLIMKPDFDIPDLDFVDAEYQTPYGTVKSVWKKTPMQLDWEVVIPPNTTAEIYLPNSKKPRKVGSGNHRFNVKLSQPKGVVVNEFVYTKAKFPQSHSATIVEIANGDLLTAFFGGTREGHHDVNIYLSRKAKGSSGWSPPVEVANGQLSANVRKACYNPVLFENTDGVLYLFYKVGNRVSDWQGFVKTSRDGGHRWSEAYPLPEGYLGPIKNKPVHIGGGRVIAPSSTEGDGWRVHFEISEDNGRKIHKVGPISASPAIPTHLMAAGVTGNDMEGGDDAVSQVVQAIQPSILQHRDGRLQILCRSRNGKVATSWSNDRGESWSPLELTSLPNNNSGTDAVTLADGRHLIVYNAVETPAGEKKGARTPLNIAVSKDGVNWQMVATLEDSPVSQYSYPSVIQGRDGRIHVVYTWRRQRIKYMELKL